MKWWDKVCNKNVCTCWFDSLGSITWRHCCYIHDLDIIHGRTKSVHEADLKLFKCVWKQCKIMAIIMYIGVKPISWLAWRSYRQKEE